MPYEYEHSVTYDFKKYKENKQIEFSANTKTQLDNYYCLIRDMDKAIILSNQGKLDKDKLSSLIAELSQQYASICSEFIKPEVIAKYKYKQVAYTQEEIELKKKLEAMKLNDDEKQKTLQAVKQFIDEALEFPTVDGRRVKVPEALVEIYVNSIKVCGNNIIEYNIRINPEVPIELPVIPDEEFNPQIHSAKKFLDNSQSSLIVEFEIDYEDAKDYANKISRKVRRVHFDKPVVIRIYVDL